MRRSRREQFAAAVVVAFILIVVATTVYPTVRETPRRTCLVNLEALCTALNTYFQEHAGHMPPAGSWATALAGRYEEDLSRFRCPETQLTEQQIHALQESGPGLPVGYSLYAPLASHPDLASVDAAKVPILFDSNHIRSSSTADLSALAFRHYGKRANIVYLDGHSESVTRAPTVPALPQRSSPKTGAKAAPLR